jgi:hypothetical protein
MPRLYRRRKKNPAIFTEFLIFPLYSRNADGSLTVRALSLFKVNIRGVLPCTVMKFKAVGEFLPRFLSQNKFWATLPL